MLYQIERKDRVLFNKLSVIIFTLLAILTISSTHVAYAVTFTDHTGYIPSWATTMGQSQTLSVCNTSTQPDTNDFKWCMEFAGYTLDQSGGMPNVTFTDHTGYIPSWVSVMGRSQTLAVCNTSTQPDTNDFKWCMEFAGYTLDQMKGSTSNPNQQSSSLQQSTILQSQDTMFSNSQIFDKSNTYRDVINHLSITPPKNSEQHSNPSSNFDTVDFRYEQDPSNPAILFIAHQPAKSFFTMDFSSLNDEQILNKYITHMITNTYPDGNYNILEKSLIHYQDGIKIKLVYQIDENGNSTKMERVLFHFNNGEEYSVSYSGTTIASFDQYSDDVEHSLNTFYVSTSISSTTVPEFPFAAIILGIATFPIVLISRIRQYKI